MGKSSSLMTTLFFPFPPFPSCLYSGLTYFFYSGFLAAFWPNPSPSRASFLATDPVLNLMKFYPFLSRCFLSYLV